MMKKIIFLLALFSILTFSGCGSSTSNRPSVVPIHEGVKGLEVNFMDNTPPDEVYVGDQFPVILQMQNKGAYNIEGGVLVINYDRGYIVPVTEEEEENNPYDGSFIINFDLNGKSEFEPQGQEERKFIEFMADRIDPQFSTYEALMTVSVCYPYKTEATATVCIDPDIYGQRQQEKVCTPQTISMGSRKEGGQTIPKGQGAPVAITRIDQRMSAHPDDDLVKPVFTIYIENMQDGVTWLSEDTTNVCREAAGIQGSSVRDTINTMKVRVFLGDKTKELDCIPKPAGSSEKSGIIRINDDGEPSIKCEYKEGIPKSRGTYTTPLLVEMDYGYSFVLSKEITIKR